MKELSLNILDIVQNSISAQATLVKILLAETEDTLRITIEDDGKGMTPEFLATVMDPFSTTRKTRKVGMGIPLFKLAAEQTGGELTLSSKTSEMSPEDHGTVISAFFHKDHMDFTPLGDVVSTLISLIQGCPDVDILFEHSLPGGDLVHLDTREMREALGDEIPLNSFEVLEWARESLNEQYGF